MTCRNCQRANLEGGVRCIYCGTPFPPRLDFDLSEATPAAVTETAVPSPQPGKSPTTGRLGLVGTLGFLAFKLKALFALFKFGKIATTLLSMLVFIAADAKLFGWRFGVGIAVSIFIHEMGHVFVNWRKGIPQTAPMFIPFVGAVIFVKRFPDDPTVESESGAGGPAAGLFAALGCVLLGRATGDPFWLGLASFGFAINLFNLVPFPPLDGSHISSVFSPKIWNTVLVTLLLWVIKFPSAWLWFVLVIGFVFRLGKGDGGRHLLAPPVVRIRMAFVYVALCLTLSYGANATFAYRHHAIDSDETQVNRPLTAKPSAKATLSGQKRTGQKSVASPVASDEGEDLSKVSDSTRHTVQMAFRFLFFLVAVAVWSVTALLVTLATNRKFNRRSFAFLLVGSGILLLIYAMRSLNLSEEMASWSFLGAYFAATFVAFAHSIYGWFNRQKSPSLSLFSRMTRCAGWAVGAALIVAYAFNLLSVFAFVALLALVFYVRFRWLAFAKLAGWAQDYGDAELAQRYTHRAITLCHDPESAAQLSLAVARYSVGNDCGGAALNALDSRLRLLTEHGTPEALAVAYSISEMEMRISALTLLDRFDEALAGCEAILQASPNDPLGGARLLAVHLRLSQIALFRGWADEAKAQSEWCLRVIKSKSLAAHLHARLATAEAIVGNLPEARKQCDLALASSKETAYKAMISAVRSEIDLLLDNPADAEIEAAFARKAFPANPTYKYRYGVALRANGKQSEGDAELKSLAETYPNEHWGRLAQKVLTNSL